jgi:dCTP deaminase
MTILSDREIFDLCHAGMVTPFEPSLLNPASLDLRLGGTLLIESAASTELVAYPLGRHSQDSPYLMVPGQFVLAETAEVFHLPDDIAGQFVLKSSRAREGIQHMLAGFADPGWNGSRLTMELHNSRQLHPVAIWPDMKIGQMVFHRMSAAPQQSYAITGRYNNHRTVMGSLG